MELVLIGLGVIVTLFAYFHFRRSICNFGKAANELSGTSCARVIVTCREENRDLSRRVKELKANGTLSGDELITELFSA